jgi:hypothetical protein
VLRNDDETVTRPLTKRRPQLRLCDVSVSHAEVLDATVVLQHKKFVNLHPDSPRRAAGEDDLAHVKGRMSSRTTIAPFGKGLHMTSTVLSASEISPTGTLVRTIATHATGGWGGPMETINGCTIISPSDVPIVRFGPPEMQGAYVAEIWSLPTR